MPKKVRRAPSPPALNLARLGLLFPKFQSDKRRRRGSGGEHDHVRRVGTGMLFVTEFVEAVFLYPTGIFIFTRRGLAADLSFLIDFYGLTLFAAGGLNNGGVNDGGGCFSTFKPFSVSWRLISSSNSDRVSSCASQLR